MKMRSIILMFLLMASIFYSGIAGASLIAVSDYVVRDNKDTSTQNDDTYWIRELTRFRGLNLADTLA